jgi:hypothetical protein
MRWNILSWAWILHNNKIIHYICITLMKVMHVWIGLDIILSMYLLLSSSLDPREGPSVLGCGKLELGSRSRLPALKAVKGRARCPGIRLGRDQAIWSRTCIQNQHKLVKTHSTCIWCWDKPRVNSDSHDTPRLGFGRCHHHPPYSILCASPPHLHPNGTFSRDSQSGVPKLSWFWIPGTLGHHSFSPKPPIGTQSKPNL